MDCASQCALMISAHCWPVHFARWYTWTFGAICWWVRFALRCSQPAFPKRQALKNWITHWKKRRSTCPAPANVWFASAVDGCTYNSLHLHMIFPSHKALRCFVLPVLKSSFCIHVQGAHYQHAVEIFFIFCELHLSYTFDDCSCSAHCCRSHFSWNRI